MDSKSTLLRLVLIHLLALFCSAGYTSIQGPSNPEERVILRLGSKAASPESKILEAAKINFPEEKAVKDVQDFVQNKWKTPPGQCSSLLGPDCQVSGTDPGILPHHPRVLPKVPPHEDTLPNNENQASVRTMFIKRNQNEAIIINFQDGLDEIDGNMLDLDRLLHFAIKADNIEETNRLDRLDHMFDNEEDKTLNKTVAIMFYSPECPHCHHLASTFRKVAKEYSNRRPFVAVNCNDLSGAEICRKFNVRELPDVRIIWYKNKTYSYVKWEVEDFRGMRSTIERKWHSEKERDFEQMTSFGWSYQSLKQFVEEESNRNSAKLEERVVDENGGKDEKVEVVQSIWPECNATAIDPKWFLGKKSIPSNVTKKVLFMNWRNGSVKFYWIDFEGREKYYFEIPPGGRRFSSSFVNHIWVAKDADSDKILATWKITSQTSLFAVHPADDDDL